MNLFERVFRELNKAKVKYLVVGGVAVNLYGYARFTGDLDILLLLEEKNLERMDSAMKKLGYYERLPVSVMDLQDQKQVRKWLKEKNLKAFTFVPPKDNPLQIDVVMEESMKFEKIVTRRVLKRVSNVSIPIVSIQDLVKMKRKAGRDKDLIDLEALIKLKNL